MSEYGKHKIQLAIAYIERCFGYHTRFTAYQLAKQMSVSPDTARRRLITLYQLGLVDFVEKEYTSKMNVVLWGLTRD